METQAIQRRASIKNHSHRIGAVFYVLWGVLHILAGARNQSLLAASGPAGLFEGLADPQGFPQDALGIVRQHNMNLAIAGLFAIGVGLLMNWRNSRFGFWLNLYLVGAFDLAFILARAIPGGSRPVDWLGPVLAVLAIIFTAVGRFRGPETTP